MAPSFHCAVRMLLLCCCLVAGRQSAPTHEPQTERRARIGKERWMAISAQAQACGANTDEWHGSVNPLPAADCVIEVLNAQDQWVRVAS